jgi:hypothetical protein
MSRNGLQLVAAAVASQTWGKRSSVAREHAVVDSETAVILARMASGASLERPGEARVCGEAYRGST